MKNQTRHDRRKPSHQCKEDLSEAGKRFSYTLCITHVLQRSVFLIFSYSPNGMTLIFVDAAAAAFPHNHWVSYLCATPTFGRIVAQVATPPSLPTQINYFLETIISELNNDRHFWLHLTASRGRFDNDRSILN